MTAIDRAALIEAAAEALEGAYARWSDLVEVGEPVIESEHEAMAAAVVSVVVASVLEPLREAHAGEWDCGNPSHTNPDVGCPDCLLYCASCDVEMPCPTIRMLDQIESDVKGDE